MKSGGKVPWALVLVALAAFAASGRGCAWAQAAKNETGASANGETLEALLSTTSRAFSASECVESIRIMKHTWNEDSSRVRYYPWIDVSFPPDNSFTPPGAQEWCDCLRDNEPAGGIPSDYEGVFNTCRDKVLVGSDFNAMDICRGMVNMYNSWRFWYSYTTFCSRRLCENRDDFGSYNDIYGKPDTVLGEGYEFNSIGGAKDLYDTCGTSGCMDELSAGYCAKYRLTYGGWVVHDGSWYGRVLHRTITVDGDEISFSNGYGLKQFGYRTLWAFRKTPVAKAICDALYPTDQGRCCTYERGYATLSQCCYVKDGALEFNCAESYGGARLYYTCISRSGIKYLDDSLYIDRLLEPSCRALIDYYVAHPTYRQAKLAKLPSGQTSVVFPEAFIDDFCASDEFHKIPYAGGAWDQNFGDYNPHTPGTREYCCFRINYRLGDFVENCQPEAGSYTSLGAARLPPSVTGLQPTPAPEPEPTPAPEPEPTPPSCDACSYVDQNGDCKSLCRKAEECTVRFGKAFCVRCNFFWKDLPDGTNRQCCQLKHGDSGPLCRPKVDDNGDDNQCLTNDGPWTTSKGVPKNPQPYTIDGVQNVCYSRDNFWVNRKLCKIQHTANGEKKCKYIKKKDRKRILAGR